MTEAVDDEDEEEVVGKRRKVSAKSKDFVNFRPKREDGLYRKLSEEPESYEVCRLLKESNRSSFVAKDR